MRIVLRILAPFVLMLGAAAPSFAAGGGVVNDKPFNYGQCVKGGYSPSAGIFGPFTVNGNNFNAPPGQLEKHGYIAGCPHPDRF